MRTAAWHRRLWLALPLVLYLLVPTRNYYWDGLTFAINIEKRLPLRELLSPSHLIYPVVGLWLYKAALLIGLKTRALFLLQAVNAVLAGACVPLVERALQRRGASAGAALAGAFAFAFAATWWRFATDANAYVPAIFLLLCANDLLETRRGVWLAGLAHAVAMLFHQLAVLYFVVALVHLKAKQPSDPSRDRKAAKAVLTYTAAAMAPVLAVFLLAYRTVSGGLNFAAFPAWLTTHSPDAAFSFAPITGLAYTLRGTLRLFFGGRIASPWLALVPVAGMLIVWRFSHAEAVPSTRRNRPSDQVWLVIYVAFLFFWMPQNTFYRLFYLAPLVFIAAARMNRLCLRLLCTALFLWNVIFLIYPQSRVESNVPLSFALAQHDRWPSGTPIAFHQFHPDLWTISYFNPQVSWIGLPAMDVAVLERSRTDAEQHGRFLWLEATAYDLALADEAGRRWLLSHPVTQTVRFQDPKHEYRFYEVR
jgi:hypothetical protein